MKKQYLTLAKREFWEHRSLWMAPTLAAAFMLLTAIGLVSPGTLLKQWRIAMVAIFVVTAAITPGDVLTAQLVMGVPMMALYFLSVGLSAVVARRSARAEIEDPSKEGSEHV